VLESANMILKLVGDLSKEIDPVCKAWNEWVPTAPFQQADAGP
jgi:hypothetical protein